MAEASFTCSNSRFKTNTARGRPHGSGRACGSVFEQPLLAEGGHSLWLEHVTDELEPERAGLYWLMWYNSDGAPLVRVSPVFEAEQLREMSRQLAAFIEFE